MSTKRLQVLLEENELRSIRSLAKRKGLTVAEWVRTALRAAQANEPSGDPERKLRAVRASAANSFPTADIDQMLAEIEQGYAK